MSLDPALLDDPRRLDPAALAAAPEQEVMAAVVAFLDRWLGRGFLDHEALLRAGTAVAAAGHAGVDRAVLAWLDADPGAARLELAAWFLLGAWRAAKEALPEAGTRLFEALEGLEFASMTHMGVMSALAMVLRRNLLVDGEERARIRGALLRHRERLEAAGALPGFVSQLRWLRAPAAEGAEPPGEVRAPGPDAPSPAASRVDPGRRGR